MGSNEDNIFHRSDQKCRVFMFLKHHGLSIGIIGEEGLNDSMKGGGAFSYPCQPFFTAARFSVDWHLQHCVCMLTQHKYVRSSDLTDSNTRDSGKQGDGKIGGGGG